tara:strand:+ start:786 stop:1430 length:645 start_codon:yes stop_codon:yes gene_type:complete
MDEDLAIINSDTRNEKVKRFLINNKKLIIITISLIIILVLGFYSSQIYKDGQREKLSNKYNSAVIKFKKDNSSNVVNSMKEIIKDMDSTYSPLALYFLIDNKLINNNNEINSLFDILIKKTSLEKEIKNLIIYKKGLYNADFATESQLLDILSPIINSDSVWKSHALYLVAEYFYSKNEKQKSKEFFSQIIILENSNQDIILEAQKRLNRDLSE